MKALIAAPPIETDETAHNVADLVDDRFMVVGHRWQLSAHRDEWRYSFPRGEIGQFKRQVRDNKIQVTQRVLRGVPTLFAKIAKR